jgi:diguanylate cyclase (GGDEF)-like protein/PAS domain S-box-containing protein
MHALGEPLQRKDIDMGDYRAAHSPAHLLDPSVPVAAILDSVGHAVIVKDEASRFVHLNAPACALLGIPLERALGKTDHDVLPAAEADRIRAVDLEILASGNARSFEEEITLADGSTRILFTCKQPVELIGAEGRLLVAVISDVTALRTAERVLRDSEAHYRSFVELHPQIPWTADASGAVIEAGPGWPLLTGTSVESGLGVGWESVLHPDDLERVRVQWQASLVDGTPFDAEYRVLSADGGYRWHRSRAAPRRDEHGRIVRWYGLLEDVHPQRTAADALRESEASVKSIFDSSPDSISMLDLSGRTLLMNKAAQRMIGLDIAELADRAVLEKIFPDGRLQRLRAMFDVVRAGGTARIELDSVDAEGTHRWLDVIAAPVLDSAGMPSRMVSIWRDITERRHAEQERLQAQKQVSHMARHDVLTGLPNRVAFREALQRHLADAAGRAAPVAVLTLDLDGFKAVNDAYGHATGDLLLREVAERLRLCLVADDHTLARLGADEFAIACGGLQQPDDALAVARRLMGILLAPFELGGHKMGIGASVGVAVAPDDGDAADEVIRASAVALHQAKAAGGGSFFRYVRSMDAQRQTRQALKLSMREALTKGEFEVHYQALVKLASGRITAFEALVRWRHPERGMIAPTEFIPIAEETGLITEIGEWVLREACRECAAWPDGIAVAVNLSPVQFRVGHLVDRVRDALEESGLCPSRLQLEITESVLLGNDDMNLRTLQQIRQVGVKIAMDDFGTGYSSLGYLRSFPFDKIKLDRSFIADLPDGKSLAIMRAVAGIGKALAIATTVEGVETEAQLQAVTREGFDEAQGYLFARPVPAAQVPGVIAARRP